MWIGGFLTCRQQLSVFMELNMSQNFFSNTSCKIIMGFLLRDAAQTCFDNISFCVSHFVTLRCDEFPDICNVSNARLPWGKGEDIKKAWDHVDIILFIAPSPSTMVCHAQSQAKKQHDASRLSEVWSWTWWTPNDQVQVQIWVDLDPNYRSRSSWWVDQTRTEHCREYS